MFNVGRSMFDVLLVFLCVVLTASDALAIVDTNENGVSDPWEERYNSGNLYTVFDPQDDPDGDGWTNAVEATAGTDPLDPNPPAGIIVPEIKRLFDVWYDSDDDGIDDAFCPDLLVIDWPTLQGKRYTLFFSADLTADSWLSLGPTRSGTGAEIGKGIPLTQPDGSIPDSIFWRVKIEDFDTDSDKLTDFEEIALGSSSSSPDTDNDGVTDWEEVVNGTNPLLALDLDGDGMSDDLEKPLARQFLAVNSTPEHWGTFHAGLLTGNLDPNHDYTGDGQPIGSFVPMFASIAGSPPTGLQIRVESKYRWNRVNGYLTTDPENYPTDGYDYGIPPDGYASSRRLENPSQLSTAYLTQQIAVTPYIAPGLSSSALSWEYCLENMGGQYAASDDAFPDGVSNQFVASLSQTKFRVVAARADHEPVNKTFFKVKSRWEVSLWNLIGNPEVVSVAPVEFNLPKGRLSTPWTEELVPFTHGFHTYVSYVPVKVEQQDYNEADGIRFCRWLDSFSDNSLKADCANIDRDRFRIRIPAVLPDLTKIHIRSSGLATAVIDGLWESKSTDGGYDVTMREENGAMVSEWMLLVSDGDDDKYFNGIGTDNGRNDQTLLANFNSPIEVTLPEYQNAKTTFYAQKPLGDLEIQPYYLSPAGNVPSGMESIITSHLEKMKEIYRQIGVRVSYYGIVGKAVPQLWFNAGTVEPANHFTKSETGDAWGAVWQIAVPEKHIRVGFVDATLMAGDGWGGLVLGIAPLGSDPVIVSLKQGEARDTLAVTAHEAGHALGLDHLEQVEPVQYNRVPQRWLMRDGGDRLSRWNNEPTDTKRFQSGDFDIIRNSTFYAPN